jgi:dTDP-4-amino-4,6-dideoxygalactose transaminase
MTEPVPFADLSRQWRSIAADAMPEIAALFESSAFCLGPWVERFERDIAAYLSVRHAIGVNSGTSALHLAMIAAGIGPGDEVIVPSHTFIASAWPVMYVGATPVLCDVRPDSGNIDVTDAERRLSPRVKAIVPVHLYGQPCDMDEVMRFAGRHGLTVIEDACQAIGARWQGKPVGALGGLGCYSFYPGKNLGAAGEGGLVVTADDAMASRMRALRVHAQTERYVHGELGFNYRMEGLQGLVLGRKLPHLDGWTRERRAIARRYGEALDGLPLELPGIVHGDHVWHLYVVQSERRDALKAHLDSRGVQTGLHYPVPLHRQPALARYGFDPAAYPVADRIANRCLSLPIFAGMTDAEVGRVIEGVRLFYEGRR